MLGGEDDLVARAQAGDDEALGALYDRYHESIFRFILVRVAHQQQAEDLTGEVFMRMLDNLADYRARGAPFRAWLYSIARNLIADHYRSAARAEVMWDEVAAGEDAHLGNPSLAAERNLTLEQVRQALAQLDGAEGDVIALRFLAGLSLKEAAEALGKSVGAVKALQHRGIQNLRAALSGEHR